MTPAGLPAVTFTKGNQAVEKAIMTAMKERGLTNSVAVGFSGSSHGSSASFALSGFRGANKLPSLNWPVLSYPKNATEESQVLEQVKNQLKSSPVAAVVVEPMNAQTGLSASNNFFTELRSLTKDS